MVPALFVTLTVLLQVTLSYTAVPPFKVEIRPKEALFRVGDKQEITCRMNQCSEKVSFSWSSLQDKPLYAESQMSSNKSTLVFRSVNKNNENTIQCRATCQGKSGQASVNVRVYSFPKAPVISGHDRLVLGKESNMTCEVSDVYPAEYMTVEWLRGGEVIHTQDGKTGTESIQSEYILTPQTNNTGELITCRATLSLNGLPEEERTRETAVSMTVLSHPLEVSLHPNASFIPVQRGDPMTLFCNSSGCPHAHITWKNVTHQPLLSWNDTQTFVSQLGPWIIGLEDNGTFICEVECGSVVKSMHTEVKVFSFPSDPTIESSGPFLEGKVSNLTCTVREVFPANYFYIQWLDGEFELHSVHGNISDKPQNLSLTIPFKPKASDQNKTLTCKVSLGMEGVPLQKTASTTLTVHYSPKSTTIDVRPQTKLNEGENVTISCQTDSSPEGHVTLIRMWNGEETKLVSSNGTFTSFSIPFTNVSHTGIYVCEAVNKYGHQRTQNVQITVQAPPRDITVTVYPSKEVQEGGNITICCQSVSFPPSAITLKKLESENYIHSPNGTFLLVNLTSDDSGQYQVNATNALGYEIEIFTITVTSKRQDDESIISVLLRRINSTDFVIPVIGLGALAAVASFLDFIRRAKRKGFYELTADKQETV